MKIDLGTLILLGVAGYLVYQWQRSDLPNSTQLGHQAYWNSSLGDLTKAAMKWYTREQSAASGGYGYSEQEAAEIARVADNLNDQVGWKPGGFL